MSELVTKGFIGGHSATRGFFSGSQQAREAFLSQLEATQGATPIIRVRMDLNGDGVFEVVEEKNILSIGNLSRALEYDTGKSSFGSCTISLSNIDKRYSDNYPHALTYLNPASPARYHFRPVVIELGFDDFSKTDADGWTPIYYGLIQSKTENAEDRSVSISLIDEWSIIFGYDLAPQVRVDSIIPYADGVEDSRIVAKGTYYGDALFIPKEYEQKDKQLMIPLSFNISATTHSASDAFKAYYPNMLNAINTSHLFNNTNKELYFWCWANDWTIDGKKQWIKMPRQNDDDSYNYTYSVPRGRIEFLKALSDTINFKTSTGATVNKTLSNYFDTTNKDYDPDVRLSVAARENCSNPAFILFDIIRNLVGLPLSTLDASSATPSAWVDGDFDFSDENYYSFDVSYSYLKNMSCKVAVNVKSETSLMDVIADLCQLTRASFFIDNGRDISGGLPVRRIHFTINQPRRIVPEIKTLTEKRLRTPTISRDVSQIKNKINVSNYAYTSNEKFDDVEQHAISGSASIAVYGEKALNIDGKPGSRCFLYGSENYADFLAQHFLMLFSEPPMDIELATDLIGFTWDLKQLMAIREASNLNLDFTSTDVTGVMEVFNFAFDTRRFEIKLGLRWGGYLLLPSGNILYRWAFCETAYADEDTNGLSYFCW